MKLSLLIILLSVAHGGISPQSSVATLDDQPWLLDIELAVQQATEHDKQVLIYFSGSDWCKPCMRLRREVFETQAFKEFAASRLVLVKADFPRLKKNQLSKQQKVHNERLADKYNPKGDFPLVVVIDPINGVNGMIGYRSEGVDEYLDHLQQLIGH